MSIRKKIISDEFVIPDYLNVPHLPSLDGIRAIAVFIVLLSHINAGLGNKIIILLFSGGTLGVYVFFVLSGFLITTLLLKEKIKMTEISLNKFYIRRALRILPVAYLYLLVLFILHVFFSLPLTTVEFTGGVLLLVNLGYFHRGVYTGHFWSLSVEQQFYVVFPFILKKSYRLYINFLFLLIALIVILRCMDFKALAKIYPRYHVFFALNLLNDFVYYLDGIVIGSLLAVCIFKELFPWKSVMKYKILLHIVFLPAIFVLFNDLFFHTVFNSVLSSVLIAILIVSNLKVSNDFIFKVLNLKILKKIGTFSYSIYIWQQLIVFKYNNVFDNSKYKWMGLVVCMLILLVVVHVSYEFFEKSFMKAKQKFIKDI